MPALLLLALCALTTVAPAHPSAETFGPRPLDLAPSDLPDIPMPEPGSGEPPPVSLLAPAPDLPAPPAPPDPAAQAAAVNELFRAVLDHDPARVETLLATGVDADSELPFPVQDDLLPLFRRDFLLYYATVERGLTPLMVAAARGHLDLVLLLLEHGADPDARTRKHRTTALWLAGYAGRVPVIQNLLGVQPGSDADRTLIEVDLGSQTARVLRDGIAGEDIPISSGRKGYATPTGEFVVTNKHRRWRSTLYHADMPFYLRLSCRDFGLHAGHLPGYPASHGCIRLPREKAEELFDQVAVGTRVIISP